MPLFNFPQRQQIPNPQLQNPMVASGLLNNPQLIQQLMMMAQQNQQPQQQQGMLAPQPQPSPLQGLMQQQAGPIAAPPQGQFQQAAAGQTPAPATAQPKGSPDYDIRVAMKQFLSSDSGKDLTKSFANKFPQFQGLIPQTSTTVNGMSGSGSQAQTLSMNTKGDQLMTDQQGNTLNLGGGDEPDDSGY